ncbi:MAG: MOSC N-terminal beta barrel domain-containing protein [Pseudomonadota bacterium]|nr:MOSC N-terminal beta barrel domain-containing protein [Pseudomonadota bacterium]
MSEITITEIHRYPVKSMLGETPSEVLVSERGIQGDRAWATRDEVRGGIRGAKKLPQLMLFGARSIDGNTSEITAPDGSTCLTSSDEVNRWLSEKLDHSVTLWPLLPPDNLEHYRRGAPDSEDFEQELREIFGRTPDEPLPDLSAFAEVIEFESPPGTYFDAFPIMLMTQQSLDTMSHAAPNSAFDEKRFRANFILDVEGSTDRFPEQAWIGKELRIGEVVLKVIDTCPRCSMTTHATDTLPRDTDIMRHLVTEAEGNLGVYAKVVCGGTATQGQTVTVV